jgi:hypothetical protein
MIITVEVVAKLRVGNEELTFDCLHDREIPGRGEDGASAEVELILNGI